MAASFHEIGTDEVAATRGIFAGLFGWSWSDVPGGAVAGIADRRIGLHGGDSAPALVAYFPVPDIETAIARVEDLGGAVQDEIVDAPGFVRFGLHQRSGGDTA